MLVPGHLVLKLPGPRVDALIAAGEGIRFDANKGTPMKEWLSLDAASALPWRPLAVEAWNSSAGPADEPRGRAPLTGPVKLAPIR